MEFVWVQKYRTHFGTWNLSRKGLFNWRDEQAGDFETLVKTFVAPRRVLRIVRDFILFTRKDGELSKVVLRPHQMRAAERCLARCKEPKKRRALVWHTQGSGMSWWTRSGSCSGFNLQTPGAEFTTPGEGNR